MINVNDWHWRDNKTSQLDIEGSSSIMRGMYLFLSGIEDKNNRSEATRFFEHGIECVERALKAEKPSTPLPYVYLTKGYALLGFCKSYGSPNSQNRESIDLSKKAKENGKVAVKLYGKTTGWDEGCRHDFHCAVGLAHWDLEEYKEAKEQLGHAQSFLRENSVLQELAKIMEKYLAG